MGGTYKPENKIITYHVKCNLKMNSDRECLTNVWWLNEWMLLRTLKPFSMKATLKMTVMPSHVKLYDYKTISGL